MRATLTCFVYFEDFPGDESVLNETREFILVVSIANWWWFPGHGMGFWMLACSLHWELRLLGGRVASKWVNSRNTIGWGCSRHECCSITPPPCLQALSQPADGKTEAEGSVGAWLGWNTGCGHLTSLWIWHRVPLQGEWGHREQGSGRSPNTRHSSPVQSSASKGFPSGVFWCT